MITICKQKIHPLWAIVMACHLNTAVFRALWSIDLLTVQKNRASPFLYRLGQLCLPCNKEPGSLVLCVTIKMFISQSLRGCWVCCQELWFCECVCVDSYGLPVWSEKGCQGGESMLFAHVQTCRMDEDTDGISLWWTFLQTSPLCVWRDMETSARMDRHPIEWGKT